MENVGNVGKIVMRKIVSIRWSAKSSLRGGSPLMTSAKVLASSVLEALSPTRVAVADCFSTIGATSPSMPPWLLREAGCASIPPSWLRGGVFPLLPLCLLGEGLERRGRPMDSKGECFAKRLLEEVCVDMVFGVLYEGLFLDMRKDLGGSATTGAASPSMPL